jgi:Lon protease-like protein
LNTVLFPGGPLPLRIFETRYLDMVRQCMRSHSVFGVVLAHEREQRLAEPRGALATIENVGTSARIVDFYSLPDGLLGITCVGERKFRVLRRRRQEDGLEMGRVRWLAPERDLTLPVEYAHLGQLMRKVVPELGEFYQMVPKRFDDASWVGCRLAEILPIEQSDKQDCLEMRDPLARLARLNPLIRRAEA